MIDSMSVYLSVVIPSYNEQANIDKGALDQVFEYLSKQDYSWEVIFSDDGSTDTTVERLIVYTAKYPNVRVLKNEHAGKAPTVKAGMLAATGQWRLFTDFDQSTPLAEVEKLLDKTKQGYQVVIGSREIAGAKRGKEPLYRHLMGKGFNLFVQLFAISGIHDTQCGFKLFSDLATRLFEQLVVYGSEGRRKDAYTGAFDVELLFLAKKNGFKISEVPIHWRHRETNRVSPLKDSLRMFRDIIKIRLAALTGKYSEMMSITHV
ncbi:MAG: glycosyl transferase [Candidatus Pacebacteria bacterium CG10_big_fil_rev_8_21_14_0_10_44_11]|nr:MAG: glycosyl transferase [Candidatus Pacebacteria bacterium CG10_big_fil_rev_8_21_14_0_10_44_11]